MKCVLWLGLRGYDMAHRKFPRPADYIKSGPPYPGQFKTFKIKYKT